MQPRCSRDAAEMFLAVKQSCHTRPRRCLGSVSEVSRKCRRALEQRPLLAKVLAAQPLPRRPGRGPPAGQRLANLEKKENQGTQEPCATKKYDVRAAQAHLCVPQNVQWTAIGAGRRQCSAEHRVEYEGGEESEHSGIRRSTAEFVSSRALVGGHESVLCFVLSAPSFDSPSLPRLLCFLSFCL